MAAVIKVEMYSVRKIKCERMKEVYMRLAKTFLKEKKLIWGEEKGRKEKR